MERCSVSSLSHHAMSEQLQLHGWLVVGMILVMFDWFSMFSLQMLGKRARVDVTQIDLDILLQLID